MLISTKQKHNSLKNQSEAFQLKIRENELEVVQKTKYLGLQMDCSLDSKEQIKAVSTKVCRAIGFLRHAKSFLPMASLKNLYTGIVEPHFRYCCSVWVVLDIQTSTSCKSSKIVLLESLQTVASIPLADHSFWNWAGRPLNCFRPLVMSLKQWPSSRSMIWLHNTCVTYSPKTQLAPPTTSGTPRPI